LKQDIESLMQIMGQDLNIDDIAYLRSQNSSIVTMISMKVLDFLMYIARVPEQTKIWKGRLDQAETAQVYE
jgi:hypothetical protein